MAGLDLSGVARVLEQWTVDTVKVTRDNDAADDVLDEVTGDLTGPAPTPVYEGPGMIQPLSGFNADDDPNVARVVAEFGADYRMLLSLSVTAEFRYGDDAQVTIQGGETADPLLTGRRFRVVQPGPVTSFAVLRIVYLREQ